MSVAGISLTHLDARKEKDIHDRLLSPQGPTEFREDSITCDTISISEASINAE
jgi:hypothetical protein